MNVPQTPFESISRILVVEKQEVAERICLKKSSGQCRKEEIVIIMMNQKALSY